MNNSLYEVAPDTILHDHLGEFCKRHLNLMLEGMEPIARAVNSGDEEEIERELNHYWRNRLEQQPHTIPPASEAVMAVARGLLDNKLSLLNSEPFDLGDPIDWNQFSDDHPQLTSHLGYMYWLEPLGLAYAATGEECYAEKFLEIIESFLVRLPYGTSQLKWHRARPGVARELEA